jgi:hypothetical protein
MSPEAALGTITVRDSTGAIVHDGTIAEPYRAAEGGAVAVVIAPGAPLMRVDAAGETGRMQSRACGAGDCDERGRCLTDPPQRAASCDPANYLDKAPAARFGFEDNAHFADRGADGFIQGPVTIADGRIAVNDRVSAIGYRDVMPRLMRRVALEVAACIRDRAAASGHYPSPVPLCAQPARSASTWAASRTPSSAASPMKRGTNRATWHRMPRIPGGRRGARMSFTRAFPARSTSWDSTGASSRGGATPP